MTRKRWISGFTVIELMIVVVVIGILASIAYPSYVESVQRSRRADAMDALLSEAQRAERFFTVSNTYTGFIPNATSVGGFYEVAFATDGATFTLSASPTGAQIKDTPCPEFTIDQAGVREPAACWNR